MPFPYDKYPWLNFQELNLAYFIKHFREIFQQWDTLLNEMYDWKNATDEELAEWKSTVETGISSWETGLQQSMENWKDETEADITTWEAATLSALDAWKTATTAVFEQIRTEAAASAQAADGSATAAQTALAGAQAAQRAAETAAAGIQSEAAQIQQNTADIDDLKESLNTLEKQEYTTADGYFTTNGGITTDPDQPTLHTNIIKVNPGDVVGVDLSYTNAEIMWLVSAYYDADGTFQSRPTIVPISQTGRSSYVGSITVPSGIYGVAFAYRVFTGTVFNIYKSSSVWKHLDILDAVPDELDALKNNFESLADLNVNLFDKDSADTVTGAFLRDGSPVSGENYFYSNYFPILPGETIITKYGSSLGASQLTLYNASKTYVYRVSGTRNGDYVIYTVPTTATYQAVKYGRINNEIANMNTLMVVKGTTYPSSYKKYELVVLNDIIPLTAKQTEEVEALINTARSESTQNILYGKTAAFDGDSICAGASAGDGRQGWAGIIGTANNMSWTNYGVTGATITAGTTTSGGSNRHWVSRNIDAIYSQHPTLDYLILEGGCNDADILYDTEYPFGTLSLSDYNGTYDDTTFTGALESLFYKTLNYYPTAKIGFIIPQKMGTSHAGYDAEHSRYRAFYERAIEVCKKWGIPYIDLWDGCPLNPRIPSMYSSQMTGQENIDAGHCYLDGQHLTPTGYDVITPYIEAWMRTL